MLLVSLSKCYTLRFSFEVKKFCSGKRHFIYNKLLIFLSITQVIINDLEYVVPSLTIYEKKLQA